MQKEIWKKYSHLPKMVSKKITDKTYFDKDKIKSSNALPVTYIITLITTNSYITSLIYHIFESNTI